MSVQEAVFDISTKSRLSFSNVVEKLQIAWDATSSSALKRCPRYYQYSIIEGWSGKGESPHLKFGIEYNNALVTYHKARANGIEYDTAVLLALRYALEHTWDEVLDRPWVSDEPTKTRETLIRSVLWHLDQFQDDPFETVVDSSGKPAVEVSFRLDLDVQAYTGESYMLCGYLDRQINFVDGLWYTDYKTTKGQLDDRYFAQYTPNNQMSQYSFAGNIVSPKPIQGMFVDAAQIGVSFTRFHRSRVTRTSAQLEEWAQDTLTYIRQNEDYVKANYWPQNDTSCSQYGGCPFRPICSLSPSLREQHLKMMFNRWVWDPLVEREI